MPREEHTVPVDKLILLPADPQVGVDDCRKLAEHLQGIGLIGAQTACAGGVIHPAGDRFLDLVSFLGCSPSIELEPPRDSAALDEAVANGRFWG